MKRNGKYRFSLQFGAETEEQIRVGELLERFGNKKSTVIISAITEYIERHPEGDMAKNFSRSNAIQGIRRDELEEIIREIINDSTASADAMVTEEGRETLQGEIMNSDIEAMLGNLELFQ